MVDAAYHHHDLDIRYINCEVAPENLGDAVKGARAMGWIGLNCSIPDKVAVIDHLDGLGESVAVMGRSIARFGAVTNSSAKTLTARVFCSRCGYNCRRATPLRGR
jgi:hypothetical protein